MADLPAVSDLLNAAYGTQAWNEDDKVNRDDEGNLIGAVSEAQAANRPTAEYGNGVSLALRQLSTFVRGTASVDAWSVANSLKLPVYTTAGRPAAGTAGRLIYDSDLDTILVDDGAAWDDMGGVSVDQVDDQTLYSVDFSTLANNTLADGAEVIDGFSWTIANAAAATTFAVENGTGIHFDAAASSTAYTTSSRTATNMSIQISTLIPSWDPQRDYVIEVYFSSLTLGTSLNRVLLCMENTTNAGAERLMGGGRRNTSGTQQTYQQDRTTLLSTDVTDDCFALCVSSGNVQVASADSSGGDFPSTYAHAQAIAAVNGISVMATSSELTIAFVTGEAGGAMDAVLRRLRVRRV